MVMKNRGVERVVDMKRAEKDARNAWVMVSWVLVGWRMNLYLSRATRRMEKEEKKMQVFWMVPINLQRISISGPHGQYFVSTSITVRGMVNEQSMMSDMARVVMNTLRGVKST